MDQKVKWVRLASVDQRVLEDGRALEVRRDPVELQGRLALGELALRVLEDRAAQDQEALQVPQVRKVSVVLAAPVL